MEIETTNVIIGAGPAGLAMAGRLRHLNSDFEILEQSDRLANTWHQNYDRVCLHTVKQVSALPFKPFPPEYPNYVPRKELIQYYEDYAAELDIQPRFEEEVISVKRDNGRWRTETNQGHVYYSEHVIVCTGFNRVPNEPTWPGQPDFQGEIIHSRHYSNAAPYQGKKVMVVGMGNSGAEIALDLCEGGAETYLSVRSPINIVPRDFLGRSTQQTAMLLSTLPTWIGDQMGRLVQRLTIGNLEKFGIVRPKMPPARQLRETAKTPVLDIGTVEQIKSGKIVVFPAIDHFTSEEVYFKDGRHAEMDVIVTATGYKARIEDFVENGVALLDERHYPKGPIPDQNHFPGLFLVGFDGYSQGILHSIYRDSGRVAAQIEKDHRHAIGG
jgi:cation diffusion facilitator CzcD-associated flavoprotein CzcO